MNHLFSSMKPFDAASYNYYRYDLFHLPPQARTFNQNGNYYRIHLPNLYFWTTTLFGNDLHRHYSLYYFGKLDRAKSINDTMFLVPLPNSLVSGKMCISEDPIFANNMEEMHEKVFDAFFLNSGGVPEIPDYVGLFEAEVCPYFQENSPGVWEQWSQDPILKRKFSELFIFRITAEEAVELNDILQKHAQEI